MTTRRSGQLYFAQGHLNSVIGRGVSICRSSWTWTDPLSGPSSGPCIMFASPWRQTSDLPVRCSSSLATSPPPLSWWSSQGKVWICCVESTYHLFTYLLSFFLSVKPFSHMKLWKDLYKFGTFSEVSLSRMMNAAVDCQDQRHGTGKLSEGWRMRGACLFWTISHGLKGYNLGTNYRLNAGTSWRLLCLLYPCAPWKLLTL